MTPTAGWRVPGRTRSSPPITEAAEHRGAGSSGPSDALTRPIGLLATAIPPAGTLNVAIHVLHVLPTALGTTSPKISSRVRRRTRPMRCTAVTARWNSTASGTTTTPRPGFRRFTTSSPRRWSQPGQTRIHQPTVVRQAQEAIRWLSCAMLELDRDSAETFPTPSRMRPSTTTSPGPGNAFVDVYDTSGKLLTRLISHGDLNSPWAW